MGLVEVPEGLYITQHQSL
jgi:hypothetical protein